MKSRPNPGGGGFSSISTETWIVLGLGSILLGTIAYAIYEISEAKNVLSETNDRIGDAASAASSVSDQIAGASQSAQNVSDQIAAANQTVQGVQASPAVTTAQSLAAWWNSL